MSTLPELLTLYQEAVRLTDTLPDQSVAILDKIINDPGCSKQLKMTAEKTFASLMERAKAKILNTVSAPKEEKPKSLKDSILTVDVFAIEAIPSIEFKMPIAPEQYDRLKEDIKKRGIQEPLIVTSDFRLLCGYNRLKIAKELDIKTVPVIIKNVPPDKIVDFAVRDNVIRRHMSVQEIAQFMAEEVTQTIGRPKKGSRAKTIQDVSNTLGVSTRTVARAKAFVKKIEKDPTLANRSIKSVVEGKEPVRRIHSMATYTVGVDMTEENISAYLADAISQIYGLDLNNGDKVKIMIQTWHVRRK